MVTSISIDRKKAALCGLTDFALLAFVYFIPTLSHLTSVPFYLLEPMRVAVLLGLVVTGSRGNAYFTALTLPLFSFAVAAHPLFAKSLMMAGELALNVFLFQWLLGKCRSSFLALFASILLSKLAYYLCKFAMIKAAILNVSFISTPVWIQILIALMLSGVFALAMRKRKMTA